MKTALKGTLAGLVCLQGLSGCAQDQPVPVQPVSIVGSDFCSTMKAILPPSGKPTWDIGDTRRSIDDARKIGATVDKRCDKPSSKPAS